MREHVVQRLDENRPNRCELVEQVVLLLDGAVIEAYPRGVANAAKRAAATLLRATG